MKCPFAIWSPLPTDHSTFRSGGVDKIVLHITEGSSASSAINTFKASKAPHRVSCHFVIDRDGTIYQLVDTFLEAWHASACNGTSVGIEHAAVSGGKLPATDAQYESSAKLVAWLCAWLRLPCDRVHVLTHNEASPRDGHVLCCTGALDPNRVVLMAEKL